MFKKRVKRLDIFEEHKLSQNRLNNFLEEPQANIEKLRNKIPEQQIKNSIPELNVNSTPIVHKASTPQHPPTVIEKTIPSQEISTPYNTEPTIPQSNVSSINQPIKPSPDIQQNNSTHTETHTQTQSQIPPEPFTGKSIEAELDLVIRDALSNPDLTPSENLEIDPILLNLVKKVFMESNIIPKVQPPCPNEPTPKEFSQPFDETQLKTNDGKGLIAETKSTFNFSQPVDTLLDEDSPSSIAVMKEELKSQIRSLIENTVSDRSNLQNEDKNNLQDLENQLKKNLYKSVK